MVNLDLDLNDEFANPFCTNSISCEERKEKVYDAVIRTKRYKLTRYLPYNVKAITFNFNPPLKKQTFGAYIKKIIERRKKLRYIKCVKRLEYLKTLEYLKSDEKSCLFIA